MKTLSILLVFSTGLAFGQSTLPSRENLASWVLGFKTTEVTRPTAEEGESARTLMRAATKAFDGYLATQAEGERWRLALRLPELMDRLAKPYDAKELQFLERICEILAYDPDLGRLSAVSLFVGMIRYYVDRRELMAAADPRALVGSKLDRIAGYLRDLEKDPASFSGYDLRRELDWFFGLDAYQAMINGVRAHFSSPNIFGSVSQLFLARGANRTRTDYSPVADTILGNLVRGNATTSSSVQLLLAPNNAQAELVFRVNGTVSTNSTAYATKATVNSVGTTNFVGDKHVFLSEAGVSTTRAAVSTQSSGSITNVAVKVGWPFRRMGTRIGWRKALESQPEALAEADFKAKLRIAQRIDEQIESQLGRFGAMAGTSLVSQAILNGLPVRTVRYSTTEHALWLNAVSSLDIQLAAPNGVMAPAYVAGDFSFHAHQSAFSNYFAQFGRRRFNRAVMQKIMGQLVGGQAPAVDPAAAQSGETEDGDAATPPPAGIVLRPVDPIQVSFARDRIILKINAKKIETEDDEGKPQIISARDIRLEFTVELEGEDLLIKSVGKISALPPGNPDESKLDFRDKAIENAIRQRIEESLPEEMVVKPTALKGRLSNLGTPVIKSIRVDNGWISVSLQSR